MFLGCCRLLDLPLNVKGVVVESPDGYYNVFINSRHSSETQKKTALHELAHIEQGHFQSRLPLETLELAAEEYAV